MKSLWANKMNENKKLPACLFMPLIISKSKEIKNNGYYQLQTKEYSVRKVAVTIPKPPTQSVIPGVYTLRPLSSNFFS